MGIMQAVSACKWCRFGINDGVFSILGGATDSDKLVENFGSYG